jgi:hypothetical protein
MRVKSSLVINMFTDASIDVLHLDSNHSEEVTCNDVELYSNKIKKGGFWIFNDTDWSSTKKAQGMLIRRGFVEFFDGKSWKIFIKN